MKAFLILCATITTIIFLPIAQGLCGDGVWSAEARSLSFSMGTVESPGVRDVLVTSPNGRKRIIVKNYELRVESDGRQMRTPSGEPIGVYPLAEVGWAPDSGAFFLTWSDGGAVGSWNTDVYLLTPSGLRKAEATDNVRRDFMKRYNCDVWGEHTGNEVPNIAGLKWLKGSKQLLLIAEVPPHSSCPEMGKFMGYSVSVPSGKILVRYSAKEVKTRWGKPLGIRHGNDENYDTTKDRLAPWPK
jgi:hypothetical protein